MCHHRFYGQIRSSNRTPLHSRNPFPTTITEHARRPLGSHTARIITVVPSAHGRTRVDNFELASQDASTPRARAFTPTQLRKCACACMCVPNHSDTTTPHWLVGEGGVGSRYGSGGFLAARTAEWCWLTRTSSSSHSVLLFYRRLSAAIGLISNNWMQKPGRYIV